MSWREFHIWNSLLFIEQNKTLFIIDSLKSTNIVIMKIEMINKKFGSYAKRLLKVRWLALLTFAVAIVGGIVGLKHLVVETSFDDYFVEGDPMLIKTDEFKAHFGNDYFIGVLTECDNHFTPEALTTLRALSNELLDSISYVDKITSLTDIEFLVGNDEGMAIEQIVPDVIPTDKAGLDSIRTLAYSKPEIARKLVSRMVDCLGLWLNFVRFQRILYGRKREQ